MKGLCILNSNDFELLVKFVRDQHLLCDYTQIHIDALESIFAYIVKCLYCEEYHIIKNG